MAVEAWAVRARHFWASLRVGAGDNTRHLPISAFDHNAIQLIQDLLEARIDARTAAISAAESVTAQINIAESCDRLWCVLISAAREISDTERPGASSSLVNLLGSLAVLPDAINRLDIDVLVPDLDGENDWETKYIKPGQKIVWDGVLWKELPQFGWEMREWWEGPSGLLEQQGENGNYDLACQHWTNLNVWTAAFVAEYAGTVAVLAEYKIYGVWSISMALEHPDDGMQSDSPTACLRAACAWIRIAGNQVASLVGRGDAQGAMGSLWMLSDLHDGSEGQMTHGRWNFWRHRLQTISQQDQFSAEGCQLAAEALQHFDAIQVPKGL